MDTPHLLQPAVVVPDYDVDFYAWSIDQAARIRALHVPGLDVVNVAEEIESLGRSDKRELLSRGEVLLLHLLKWQLQPQRRGESWVSTISEQRSRIGVVLDESPSLRPTWPAVIARRFQRAVKRACQETELPPAILPASCAWTPEQVLDEDWLPGG